MLPIRGIFIDAENLEIREVELENSCSGFYKWLKCDCITAPSYDDFHDVVVDDEGLLKKPFGFFEIIDSEYANEYAGNGMIVGYDCNGNWISHSLNIEEVKKHIRFTNYFRLNGQVCKVILKEGAEK